MAYPAYIREKERTLRVEKRLTIDEIAERLALSRTTIYYWVRDIPISRKPTSFSDAARLKGNRVMRRNFRRLREEAYAEGRASFDDLARDRTFRDFVNLYMAEGSKRCRNTVAICNSDPAIIVIAARWIRKLSGNKIAYSVLYHADQDLGRLKQFWGSVLDVGPEEISTQRKSNSNGLAARNWRSKHGVLTIRVSDTYLRARLEAWMNRLRESWLDSA